MATADHNVPTINQHLPIKEELSRLQVEALKKNCEEHGIELYGLGHPFQGIVHVIGPELGITQPGMTIVCGDSHTSTHGAFGSIAFGIGTSEVEMVMATQCLMQSKPKLMRINVDGNFEQRRGKQRHCFIHPVADFCQRCHWLCSRVCRFCHPLISMEARMTICNMSIEMGARCGMIAPDETTFSYIKGRKFAPQGADWDKKLAYWKTLHSDEGAVFDKKFLLKAEDIEPMITYGTNPGMGIGVSGHVPSLNEIEEKEKPSFEKSLAYMGLQPGAGHQRQKSGLCFYRQLYQFKD